MKAIIQIELKNYQSMPDFNQNDVAQVITFFVKDNYDQIINLTGATVRFKTKLINTSTNKINGVCTLDAPLNGECSYTTGSLDLNTIGVFDSELQVTIGSKITTIPLGRFNIWKDLPN